MLAKEMKMQNVAKQEYFIREHLGKAAKFSKNGSVSFLYIGFIYKEVRAALELEGICFQTIGANSSGVPTVLLYPSDCDLTPEELEEAQKSFRNIESQKVVDIISPSSHLEPIDYMH